MDFVNINKLIKETEQTLKETKPLDPKEKYYVGVDLGTAYIVLVVLNSKKEPVACEMEYAEVLRDGLVVDYIGALQIVRKLKEKLEDRLDIELTEAAIAIPPGVSKGDTESHRHIVEGAGFIVTNILDEPTAANSVIGLKDGVLVDIGGGTTGITVFKDGEVIHVVDEPTGGTHLSLVLAGSYNISFSEAEELKKDKSRQREILPIVTPVIEKMASIIMEHTEDYQVEDIHLVGGTCALEGFEDVVEKYTGKKTFKPVNPFLVTPIGIAMNS